MGQPVPVRPARAPVPGVVRGRGHPPGDPPPGRAGHRAPRAGEAEPLPDGPGGRAVHPPGGPGPDRRARWRAEHRAPLPHRRPGPGRRRRGPAGRAGRGARHERSAARTTGAVDGRDAPPLGARRPHVPRPAGQHGRRATGAAARGRVRPRGRRVRRRAGGPAAGGRAGGDGRAAGRAAVAGRTGLGRRAERQPVQPAVQGAHRPRAAPVPPRPPRRPGGPAAARGRGLDRRHRRPLRFLAPGAPDPGHAGAAGHHPLGPCDAAPEPAGARPVALSVQEDGRIVQESRLWHAAHSEAT